MSVLAQWASGEYAPLLALTETRHATAWEGSGNTYTRGYSRLTPAGGFADKAAALVNVLNAADPDELVIWLDADCVVNGSRSDLVDALPEGAEVGMVRNVAQTFNTGAIWMRNTNFVRMFWNWFAGTTGLNDKRISNATILTRLYSRTVALDPQCNWYQFSANRTGVTPIVQAWHELPTVYDKEQAMKKYLVVDD